MEYSYYITPNQYEIALGNGISNKILAQRVRSSGWNIEKASVMPLQNQGNRKITAEMMETLKRNNISLDIYRRRIKRYAWSIEKALNTPVLSRKEVNIMANKSTRKISLETYERAEENGISNALLRQRMSTLRWSLEKSMNTPVMTKRECADCGSFNKIRLI